MNILVTGGAGYIGSHVVKQLGELTNHNITILDNLSTGFTENILFGNLIECDLENVQHLDEIFAQNKFDVVIHFAGSIEVLESIQEPLKYYKNNTNNTVNLIELSVKYNVKKFIFSSTAAVYGNPDDMIVKEQSPTNPINPYGRSKLMSEQVLMDTANVHKDFNYVILRYFNVAGASVDNKIGQRKQNATHLISMATKTALGQQETMYINGDDYDTGDGTCIRDYIHIEDLASAHLSVIDYDGSAIFNCGYSQGFSVKEVIDTMKEVSGVNFNVAVTSRREGDIEKIVADNSNILAETSWQPKYNDLKLICKSSLEWEKKIQ